MSRPENYGAGWADHVADLVTRYGLAVGDTVTLDSHAPGLKRHNGTTVTIAAIVTEPGQHYAWTDLPLYYVVTDDFSGVYYGFELQKVV